MTHAHRGDRSATSVYRALILTLLLAGLAAGVPAPVATAAPVLTESEVTFQGDGVELSGTVLAPAGAGRRPGIVATVWLLISALRARQSIGPVDRTRLSLLSVAGVVFVPWALWWGLLLP